MKKRIKVSQVALYGILTLISVLWIIPVLFIFSLSVTSGNEPERGRISADPEGNHV